ncbi:MAG: thiamine phosphate synthase [Vicinamibacterales bacterium]
MSPVWCLITDRRRWGTGWRTAVPARVHEAARAGVHLIQVREPDLEGGALHDLVTACVEAVRGTRSRVLVNDRLDVALTADAHGVHLRGDSMPASRVRALVHRPFLIGRSIHSLAEAQEAESSSLDYLILGTVFPSASKPEREPLGLAGLRAIVSATGLPVLAVGGVTDANVQQVLDTGAAGAAAIGLFAGGRE